MSTMRFPERDPPPRSPSDPPPAVTHLDISWATLARVVVATLLTLAALWLITSLAQVIVMSVLAILIAVVLSDLVAWLQRKGISRGLAALISIAALVLVGGVVLAIAVPPLVHEVDAFFDNLPRTTQSLRSRLSGEPALYNALVSKVDALRRDPSGLLSGALHFGFGVASNVFGGVLLLTLALYFLIDGERMRAVVLRFTPQAYRARVQATMSGTAGVIKAYFIGRSIISALFAIFTFLLLTVLHVPYAMVFAVLAFFLGSIPNIGSLLATVLPALVALAYRGITTALIVVGVLLAYQQLENNFIQPRVLSKKLNVPSVATLIGVLAGAKLLGILGIILATPFVGMLPVLERIWIRREAETAPLVPQ
ncbi:MAG: AI-2E family transporter [Longimicrobiales bacterium]